ncbi:MAG: DUF4403 family protein [Candidatus Schekmanbacteria bacterium]|nr:DUF4403 family protein [Candidatus Schekmanbacteria bacterium]
MHRIPQLAAIIATAAMLSCSPERAGQSRPPRASTAPPAVPLSSLTIPIEVSLPDLAAQINGKVPRILRQKGFEGDPEGVKLEVRRGDISLSAAGQVLTIKVPISFSAEARPLAGKLSNGPRRLQRLAQEDRPGSGPLSCSAAMDVELTSSLSVDADWNLVARTTPGSWTWAEPCLMTPLKIDVTRKIDEKLGDKLAEISSTLDARISAAADIRDKVTRAWEALQQAKKAEQGFWLALAPESLALGAFDGNGEILRTRVAVRCRPALTLSEPVAARSAALAVPRNGGAGAIAESDGFSIAVEAKVAVADATRLLAARLEGKRMTLAGHHVEVRNPRVSAWGDQLAIDAELSGAVDLAVTLVGVPAYDAVAGELVVRDLDYAVETKNALAQSADWLLHEHLQKAMADHAHFPLGEKMAEARARVEKSLNRDLRPGVHLEGTVSAVEPLGVYVAGDAFLAIVLGKGQLRIRVA